MLPWRLDGGSDPVATMRAALAATAGREDVVRALASRPGEADLLRAAEASAARRAAGQALSPLDGMPVGIKDIMETADLPTQMGCAIHAGFQAGRDAAAAAALRRAGAIVAGKAATTAYAIGPGGPTTNPHDPARSPGGSSSGSAAGVAAGFFSAALGTQTMGSVIRPASYCGTFGYKPGHGLLSMQGVHPLSPTLDHMGVLAADLPLCWAVAKLLADGCATPGIGDPGDHGLPGAAAKPSAARHPARLLFLRTAGWDEPAMQDAPQAAFAGLLQDLGAAGVEIVDPQAAGGDAAAFEAALVAEAPGAMDILTWEMQWPLAEYARQHGAQLPARIHDLLRRGAALDARTYGDRLAARAAMQGRFHDLLAALGTDAVIMPSASGPAPRGLADTGSRTCQMYWSWLGVPALSLPLLQVGGMPFGVQLVGAAGSDSALFGTAAALLGLHRAGPQGTR
ncbi:amidase family protein [Marinibaculum pumilum]|uniref:Amidase family protein n=1 Tax=Marinibaculum pumilum TaxID=1766165 RepID=A0ABV7L3G8_9PROT